jgi:hypothetical protein
MNKLLLLTERTTEPQRSTPSALACFALFPSSSASSIEPHTLMAADLGASTATFADLIIRRLVQEWQTILLADSQLVTFQLAISVSILPHDCAPRH